MYLDQRLGQGECLVYRVQRHCFSPFSSKCPFVTLTSSVVAGILAVLDLEQQSMHLPGPWPWLWPSSKNARLAESLVALPSLPFSPRRANDHERAEQAPLNADTRDAPLHSTIPSLRIAHSREWECTGAKCICWRWSRSWLGPLPMRKQCIMGGRCCLLFAVVEPQTGIQTIATQVAE